MTRLAPASRWAAALSRDGEDAGAFQRDVDAEFAVRQLGGLLDGRDLDRAAPDVDRVALDGRPWREPAVDRVVTQQVGVGLDRPEIVDRHDLDVLAPGFDDRAQDVAADAAEAVDGNLHRHGVTPSRDGAPTHGRRSMIPGRRNRPSGAAAGSMNRRIEPGMNRHEARARVAGDHPRHGRCGRGPRDWHGSDIRTTRARNRSGACGRPLTWGPGLSKRRVRVCNAKA